MKKMTEQTIYDKPLYKMPLICQSLSHEEMTNVNHKLMSLSDTHPLKLETTTGDVTVTEENGKVIFQSTTGFYFRSGTPFQAIIDDIHTPRHYMCTAFELAADTTIPERIHARFQENIGKAYADAIETTMIERNDKQIMLLKLPIIALQHLLADKGGVLKTAFSGPTDTLRTIPTLARFIDFPKTNEYTSSVFATQYPAGDYDKVRAIHGAIIRELIKQPNSGICLKWIARWEA